MKNLQHIFSLDQNIYKSKKYIILSDSNHCNSYRKTLTNCETYSKMFTKLLQTYPLNGSVHQKQHSLRQTIDQNAKLTGIQILKDLQSKYNEVLPILKNHPQIVAQFLFQHFSQEDCLRLMNITDDKQLQNQGNGFIRLLNDISLSLTPGDNKTSLQWFSKMYSRYSSLQKLIILLKHLSTDYHNKYTQQYFPQFLADFIKTSALAIQAFLKLKVQSPKFDIDFIEHGQKFVQNTQKWVKGFYIKLIKTMRVPQEESNLQKTILNGVSDVIGAVMQVQRQGNIQTSICDEILDECYRYIKRITSLLKFNKVYLKHLHSQNFHIPYNKIVLPNYYPSNIITIPKQTYCYIMYKFLNESSYVYSNQQIYNCLVPLINQLAQFQYQIKPHVQKLFLSVISSKQVQIKTCFEGQVPLTVVWFTLWHYQQRGNKKILKQIDQIFQHLIKSSPKTYTNSLRFLTSYKVEDIQNQLNLFIGEKLLQVSKYNAQQCLLIVKNMNWSNTNQKGQNVWHSIIEQLIKDQKSMNYLHNLIKNTKQKTKFQTQIQSILTKTN